MERNHVGARAELAEGHAVPARGLAGTGGEDDLHAEGAGQRGHLRADAALADDAHGRTGKVADGTREEAELPCPLPGAVPDLRDIGDERAAQREEQGEDMLRHGVDRIAADIRDRHAAIRAGGHVHAVGPGRRDGDEAQRRGRIEFRRADAHLVGDRDLRAGKPRGGLAGRGAAMLRPVMGEAGAGQGDLRGDGLAVEKDDAGHAGTSPTMATAVSAMRTGVRPKCS
nr:hypothetical protein [Mangrovicoccus ximenensis]